MKTNSLVSSLMAFLILSTLVLVSVRCKKDTDPMLPSVKTDSISEITQTTAYGSGNVTADGGATITARGICWSTSVNPTMADNPISGGTGTGSFSCSITGLSPSTTYHVRTYATNSVGTAYGEDLPFTTPGPTGLNAYYKFDGNINDESENANNGTNFGATFVPDRFGNSNKAIKFDGSNDYAEIPNSASLNITGDLSLCYWVKKGNADLAFSVPISKRNSNDQEIHFVIILIEEGFGLNYSGEGAPLPNYDLFNPVNSVYNLLNDGNWHFVVFTHTFGARTNDKLFVDNISYQVTYPNWHTSFNYPAVPDNSTLKFGCQMSQNYYNGLLDDIRIYSKILTTDDINTLYHEGGW